MEDYYASYLLTQKLFHTSETDRQAMDVYEGKTFDSYKNMYAQGIAPERKGMGELAALYGSSRISADKAKETNQLAIDYAKQTDAFNLQLAEQGRASEAYARAMDQANTRLMNIKAGSPLATSKASTERQFAQLSQQRIQNTNRYLQELGRFSTPQGADIDFTFRDPITGKELSVDTEFGDVYGEDYNPNKIAKQMVQEDFARRRAAISESIRTGLMEEYGNLEDYDINQAQLGSARQRLQTGHGSSADRAYVQYAENFDTLKTNLDRVEDYAEAKAIAEMGGFEGTDVSKQTLDQWKNYHYHGAELNRLTAMGYGTIDSAASFYQQDINAILDDMTSATVDRLEIDRVSRREDAQKEFERSRERALSQRGLFESQLIRNQEQEQYIAEEKRRVQQLLEDQKRELAQGLSSFGDTTSSSSDQITFTDTRPE